MNVSETYLRIFQTHGILLARVLMGGMFAFAGFSKLVNISGTASYITSVGLPESSALALAAGLLELLAGLAILTNNRARHAALALAIFVVVVSFLFHAPSTWAQTEVQQILFTKNAAILAGLLFIVAHGAGRKTTGN